MTCTLLLFVGIVMGASLAGLFAEVSFSAWMGDGWFILGQRILSRPGDGKSFVKDDIDYVFGHGDDSRPPPRWWYYARYLVTGRRDV
jgi:hypothetical protein